MQVAQRLPPHLIGSREGTEDFNAKSWLLNYIAVYLGT